MTSYPELRAMLAGERLPAAFVDLDALDHNLSVVLDTLRDRGTPLRVASKSVRVVALLKRMFERGEGMLRGVMCFSCEEAEHLASHGFDDLLVAYPAYQRCDLDRIAKLLGAGTRASVVADSHAGVDRISEVGEAHGVRIPVVLCVDMSLELLGGRVHLGVRRSPLRDKQEVLDLAVYPSRPQGRALPRPARLRGAGRRPRRRQPLRAAHESAQARGQAR